MHRIERAETVEQYMTKDTPTLSVIIASVNGLPMIEDCLASLAAQQGNVHAEVIVMDVAGEETVNVVREEFPWVQLVTFGERRTIPQLRAAGLQHAAGEIIAIIEDHCVADPHWYEEIVNAHRAHPEYIAVGGPVENGSRHRLVDWAVFFCEYSTFMMPLPRGRAEDIPGNNAAYKRRAFQGLSHPEETLTSGFWESTLHRELRARGDQFFLEPAMVVYHKKHFGFWYFLGQRYHYSRYYAGRLVSGASLPRRVLRSAAALALPLLLLSRIARRIVKKKRHLRELLLTSPLLVIFTGAWAIGEMVGGMFGPGQSLREVD